MTRHTRLSKSGSSLPTLANDAGTVDSLVALRGEVGLTTGHAQNVTRGYLFIRSFYMRSLSLEMALLYSSRRGLVKTHRSVRARTFSHFVMSVYLTRFLMLNEGKIVTRGICM